MHLLNIFRLGKLYKFSFYLFKCIKQCLDKYLLFYWFIIHYSCVMFRDLPLYSTNNMPCLKICFFTVRLRAIYQSDKVLGTEIWNGARSPNLEGLSSNRADNGCQRQGERPAPACSVPFTPEANDESRGLSGSCLEILEPSIGFLGNSQWFVL